MRVENYGQNYPTLSARPAQVNLEKAFLEEMVKYILPSGSNEFSGGVGEEQFRSLMNKEYATALSHRLKLGLELK